MKEKALCRALGQVSHLRLAAEINIFAKKHLIDNSLLAAVWLVLMETTYDILK